MDKFEPWYTENEIIHFLKQNRYSDEIAKELAPWLTKQLNSAYRKGWSHGNRNYNPAGLEPIQEQQPTKEEGESNRNTVVWRNSKDSNSE